MIFGSVDILSDKGVIRENDIKNKDEEIYS